MAALIRIAPAWIGRVPARPAAVTARSRSGGWPPRASPTWRTTRARAAAAAGGRRRLGHPQRGGARPRAAWPSPPPARSCWRSRATSSRSSPPRPAPRSTGCSPRPLRIVGVTAFDPAELKLLTDLIEERFGLIFQGIRREILESRLRAAAARAPPRPAPRLLPATSASIPTARASWPASPAMVTNNETYFFRETHQFDLLIEPRASRAAGRSSGAGRSGSSPPAAPRARSRTRWRSRCRTRGWRSRGLTWEIDACDVNAERIARAQEALYDRELAPRLRRRDAARATSRRAGRLPAQGTVPAGVRFFETNLVAPNGAARLGGLRRDPLPQHAHLLRADAFTSAHRPVRPLAPARAATCCWATPSRCSTASTPFAPALLGGAVVYRKLEAAA